MPTALPEIQRTIAVRIESGQGDKLTELDDRVNTFVASLAEGGLTHIRTDRYAVFEPTCHNMPYTTHTAVVTYTAAP